MEKAYIILAHKNIEQLIRLLKSLDDDSSYFFVHIDQKVGREELILLSGLPHNVQMVKRVNANWAGFSLVEATLNAMESIKAFKKDFDTIILLSGQDYPVKCNDFINHFFKTSERRILMEYFNVPNHEKWSPRGGLYRLDKYFFGLKPHQLLSSRILNFLSKIFPFLKRNHPVNLKPYAGSQWWAIDMYALNYILEFVKGNPAYSNFHRSTFAPDELFFHTIILNAKDKRISNSIVNNNRRFIRWSDSTSHPDILQKDDLHEILNSDALFARKLDLDEHPELFDLIDLHCLKEKTVNISYDI